MFCSPLSISVTLAMTLAGAKGATAEEIKKALKLDMIGEDTEIHTAFQNVLTALLKSDVPRLQLCLANRMFVHHQTNLSEQFVSILKKSYNATAAKVDFVEESALTCQEINQWVEKQTKHKIRNLLSPGMLNKETILVLVNAIYFRGEWASKFDKYSTLPDWFAVSKDERRFAVDMMHIREDFKFLQNNELSFKMLELPYVNETMSMFLILPNDTLGLSLLEEKLSADLIEDTIKAMRKVDIEVSLPRFKIESSLRLNQILKAMGMERLFSYELADLSGITAKKPQRNLFVSTVVQKAFVEVNEDGSEAAAACGGLVGGGPYIPPKKEFKADHPFIFFIRDNESGCILFWGRVMKPSPKTNTKLPLY